MAGTGMRVTTEELRRSASVLEEKTARYQSEYEKIYAEIANLRVEWSGSSSDTFNTQIEGYKPDFIELATTLKAYSEFLKTTAQKIEETERTSMDAARKLPGAR